LSGGPLCSTPGCGKGTYNGQPGAKCSRSCGSGGASPSKKSHGVVCSTPGCVKPTWNGQPGEKCSRSCVAVSPSGAGAPSFVRLLPADQKYQDILHQYTTKWLSPGHSATPIDTIYEVNYDSKPAHVGRHFKFRDRVANVAIMGHGKQGNVQRRFHGTGHKCHPGGSSSSTCGDPTCPMCNIIRHGFDMTRVSSSTGDQGVYGNGLYFTSVTSTAKGYGISNPAYQFLKGGQWWSADAGNVILVCSVTCGNAHVIHPDDVVQYPKIKTSRWTGTPLQAGQHSRIIDKPVSGVDECVIFDADQVLVTHVLFFK